jgi:predicted nuclease of restriction endonuclease-like RecB superfamily
VLHYLTERDEPWLRALIDEYQRGVGEKRSELSARLRKPLTVPAPKSKQRLAAEVLIDLSSAPIVRAVPPRDARGELFLAAATATMPRPAVLRAVASQLGTDAESLEASLFADLPSECQAGPLPADVSPSRVSLEANLRLVNSWIRRARSVRLMAWGNARALVRQARLHGLICNVRRAPSAGYGDGLALEISGPLSLFRHTSLYARALCALVPRALCCPRFELVAVCDAGPGLAPTTLVVRSGDPLPAGREPRAFDGQLEERFVKDFRKAGRDWDVVREPCPVENGGSLLFPDFELLHRHEQRRFLLEIVGFWTPKYLQEKLSRLRAAKLDNVILCIDEARACSDAELPEDAAIVRYRRRIDVAKILAVLAAWSRP